jgi:hypothetical protein
MSVQRKTLVLIPVATSSYLLTTISQLSFGILPTDRTGEYRSLLNWVWLRGVLDPGPTSPGERVAADLDDLVRL